MNSKTNKNFAIKKYISSELKDEDLEQIAALRKAMYENPFSKDRNPLLYFNLPIASHKEEIKQVLPSGFILTAKSAEKIVAYIFVTFKESKGIKFARLGELYTLEGYRRKGIGTSLVNAAIESIKKEGRVWIDLFIDPDNLESKEFWDKFLKESRVYYLEGRTIKLD